MEVTVGSSVYRRYWRGVVEKLKEKYSQWTSRDILNLRFHFEVVTEDYKYLLHFCALTNITSFNSPQVTNRSDYLNKISINNLSRFHHELWDSEELLEIFQVDCSPEQRRAMFDAADTHQCGAINFEGFLEVINYEFLQNS
ncbi:uncharacterized protein si:ch211-122l24.6 [Chanodichthys erythropterus]|uniref:uncharacterized protein si:ch211-122l24.6 n=1 Tax=Chanodichthys erythropterus TaxID=933992 RepID=UPI00351DCBFE